LSTYGCEGTRDDDNSHAPARFGAGPLLPLQRMDSNEQLRQRALRLVNKFGISHKVLAARMGMTPSMFSRWLHKKPNAKPASVLARDGFDDYVQELQDHLQQPAPTRTSGEATPTKRRHTAG